MHPDTGSEHDETDFEFTVSGSGGLLDSLVTCFVRTEYPEGHVTAQVDPAVPRRTARLALESAGRWLLVSSNEHADLHFAEALSAGACAVIGLDGSADDFRRALRALAVGGETYVPADVMRWLAQSSLPDRAGSHVDTNLTQREAEVLRLIADGHTNAEIGAMLSISVNTVRTHLHTLTVKLAAPNRTQLIAMARRMNDSRGNNRSRE